ncbi:MAG: KEOPS complex subunit Pcc1 [Candidatus ainarchaeum sp.]|nr:KEOPS complex subunit Pcc1 [Candidatus ainarchaeum sp.]MDD3975659.1 KEOPS complex subunit Pcc1 [Candidatus ainarchaeum sp.]
MIDNILSSEIIISTKESINLKKLLDLEIKRKDFKRSDSEIYIDNSKNLVIKIFAKDIIAFKATMNNYISLLELISKTYEVDL